MKGSPSPGKESGLGGEVTRVVAAGRSGITTVTTVDSGGPCARIVACTPWGRPAGCHAKVHRSVSKRQRNDSGRGLQATGFGLQAACSVAVDGTSRDVPCRGARRPSGANPPCCRACAGTIVEGCARRATKDCLHFMTMALGLASEVRYLLGPASRRADCQAVESLESRYTELIRSPQKLTNALE